MDLELLNEISIEDTQQLLNSGDTLKHKVVYIAGFLVHKYDQPEVNPEDETSSEFLDELDRGGLTRPTLNTVFFVHCSVIVHQKIPEPRRNCCNYFRKLISRIDATISNDQRVCQTLTNVIYKGYVLNNSDRERELGCLRRKEKLSKC